MGRFMFEFFVALYLRSALFTVACSDTDSRAAFLPLDSTMLTGCYLGVTN